MGRLGSCYSGCQGETRKAENLAARLVTGNYDRRFQRDTQITASVRCSELLWTRRKIAPLKFFQRMYTRELAYKETCTDITRPHYQSDRVDYTQKAQECSSKTAILWISFSPVTMYDCNRLSRGAKSRALQISPFEMSAPRFVRHCLVTFSGHVLYIHSEWTGLRWY